jgi:hypothetical protein
MPMKTDTPRDENTTADTDRRLKYRGRFDEGRTTPPRAEAPRELVEAMRAIATTGVAPGARLWRCSVGLPSWKMVPELQLGIIAITFMTPKNFKLA